jgi:surfactin synthase thioesterase subunit/phosphopantetheinyl transferase
MFPSPSLESWLPFRRALAAPRLRLFALPYAGGGASLFRRWPDGLPADVEVCAIQLPGRETRFKEPPYVRMRDLVAVLADAIAPELDRPYVLFGHSMGALVAWELTREIRLRKFRPPETLIVAGHAAPHRPARGPALHALPDSEFRSELERLNGTPDAVLNNEELLEAFLPTLRADFAVCETYNFAAEGPLDVPIIACGGIHDARASFDDVDAWRVQTRAPFTLRMFAGDHFFIQSHRDEMLGFLSERLATIPSRGTWPATTAIPPLDEQEIHVWQVDLDDNVEKLCRLDRLLADDERARAERFHFAVDRWRFIVGRIALRYLLGAYLRREPETVRLCYNLQGKPGLIETQADIDLRFNVAHSAGMALIALARGRTVGIDLERIRPDVECVELARRYFSRREVAALESLPAPERIRTFFAGWTRKEAYLKAHGVGLSLPLDQFSVSFDDPPRLLTAEHDPNQMGRWEFHPLTLGSDWAGALVAEGSKLRVRCAKWCAAAVE